MFRRAGLDAAELIYQDDYSAGLPIGDVAAARESRRVADDLGLAIVGLTPYATGLNALDATIRRQSMDEFRHAIEAAGITGATRIRVYAGSWGTGGSESPETWRRAWETLVESLRVLAPEADTVGATLVVENHFGTMTRSAADTARLVRTVGSESVGVLYDQANLTFTHDESFEEALRIQGDLVRHVHVKDLVFTEPGQVFVASETARVKPEERAVRSRVVGDGIIPWAPILQTLIDLGYDGPLSLEYEYRWHPQDLPEPEDGFRRSASHLRELLSHAQPRQKEMT